MFGKATGGEITSIATEVTVAEYGNEIVRVYLGAPQNIGVKIRAKS